MFHVKRHSVPRVAVPLLDRAHGSARGLISPESQSREGSIPQPRRLTAPTGNRHYGFTTCNGVLAEIRRWAQSPLRKVTRPLCQAGAPYSTPTLTPTPTPPLPMPTPMPRSRPRLIPRLRPTPTPIQVLAPALPLSPKEVGWRRRSERCVSRETCTRAVAARWPSISPVDLLPQTPHRVSCSDMSSMPMNLTMRGRRHVSRETHPTCRLGCTRTPSAA